MGSVYLEVKDKTTYLPVMLLPKDVSIETKGPALVALAKVLLSQKSGIILLQYAPEVEGNYNVSVIVGAISLNLWLYLGIYP